MPNTERDSGIRTARGFARCPKCQELIDAASEVCRFCRSPVSTAELQQSAALQQKLIEAKSKANDRSSLIAAIKALVIAVLIYALWLSARFFRSYR